jgi:ferric-dicitrate binding protein FerR (iron transport regulator)
MRSRRNARLAAQLALVAALLLLAAIASFHRWVEEPARETIRPAAAATVATPHASKEEAVVEAVVGPVQRNAGGTWASLVVGDRLHPDDSLRTGKGASTALRIDDRSRLTIQESSQVTIRELTERLHRFKLTRGRVAVDYKPDGERVLRIENESSDAVAETREARFSVLSTGTSLAIATESGAVQLKAEDHAVLVAAGEQAFAQAGAPPSAPAAIPTDVLLKVANAAAQGTSLCADIEGTAEPGAEVLVDGEPAHLDARGRFSVRVPKTSARKLVRVAMRMASGLERVEQVPCTPEISEMSIRWKRGRQ